MEWKPIEKGCDVFNGQEWELADYAHIFIGCFEEVDYDEFRGVSVKDFSYDQAIVEDWTPMFYREICSLPQPPEQEVVSDDSPGVD